MSQSRKAAVAVGRSAVGAAPPVEMACRPRCGACCIALSISTPFPGMPQGKPAGVPCLHLTNRFACALYGHPQRPPCCDGLKPSFEMCGETREQALDYLNALEAATAPSAGP